MDFLNSISDREELLMVLNSAIDKIYKKNYENSRKFADTELNYIGNIYRQYCSNQITKSELLEYFPVNEDLKDCVLSAIEVKKSQVCQYLLDVNNSVDVPLLKSFDWDVKLISGDSTLASHRETIGTLILNTQKGEQSATHSIELDHETVKKLIEDLEPIVKEK